MCTLTDFCWLCFEKDTELHKYNEDIVNNTLIKLKKCIPNMFYQNLETKGVICIECCSLIDIIYNFHEKCLKNKLNVEKYLQRSEILKNNGDFEVMDNFERKNCYDILKKDKYRIGNIIIDSLEDDLDLKIMESEIKNDLPVNATNGQNFLKKLEENNVLINNNEKSIENDSPLEIIKLDSDIDSDLLVTSEINNVKNINNENSAARKQEKLTKISDPQSTVVLTDVETNEMTVRKAAIDSLDKQKCNKIVIQSPVQVAKRKNKNTVCIPRVLDYTTHSTAIETNQNFYDNITVVTENAEIENNLQIDVIPNDRLEPLKALQKGQTQSGTRGRKRRISETPRCKDCGEEFRLRSELSKHSRLHSGKNLIKCTICEQLFTESYDLLRHRRDVHGEKPFVCKICSMAYFTRRRLKTHSKKHSKNKGRRKKKKKYSVE